MKVRVPNTLSARMGGYSLHHSLILSAVDKLKSTVDLDKVRDIFSVHFPLLKVKGTPVELTVLYKHTNDQTNQVTYSTEPVEMIRTSKHRRNQPLAKKKVRQKPTKPKKKK